jgi:transformation/transcription domain-associated protein
LSLRVPQAINTGCKQPHLQMAHVLGLLAHDDASGALTAAVNQHASTVPTWLWTRWIPQLLAGLGRRGEGACCRAMLQLLARDHPQALYYSLRAFVLEKREVSGDAAASASARAAPQPDPKARPSTVNVWSAGAAALSTSAEELLWHFKTLNPVLSAELESMLEEVCLWGEVANGWACCCRCCRCCCRRRRRRRRRRRVR